MPKLSCCSCPWTGEEEDLDQSWPVTDATINPPFGICPDCGGNEFDEVEGDGPDGMYLSKCKREMDGIDEELGNYDRDVNDE